MLAGCATPYGLGRAALREGRYDEAASHFQEILAGDPTRLDALGGLGISRYKLGVFDEAIDALRRVVERSPRRQEPRLYLGLSYLRKREIGLAEEQLRALADLKPHPRLAAQIDGVLQVLRVEHPLSDELAGFLAVSLEHELEWEREVREARLAQPVYASPFGFYGFPHCLRDRFGRLICF